MGIMNTGLPLLAIGLIFGGGIGFTVAAANGITLDGHDHSDPAHHGHDAEMSMNDNGLHDHGTPLVLPVSGDAPGLALAVHADPASGWNLQIMTENFTFAPLHASTQHIVGEGHAHLYINGEKIGRVYGEWLHLEDLPQGDVTVQVILNSNDHRPLFVGDQELVADLMIAN